MKKVTVLTLALGLLAGWGATQTFGIAQFYTQPCTTTAAVGTRFTLPINIRYNVDSLSGWQYYLGWDSLILRCDSVKEGTYLTLHGQTTYFLLDISTRADRALVADLLFPLPPDQPPVTDDSGNLAKMFFRVVRTGACPLTFDPSGGFNSYLFDQNANELPVTLKNGYFQTPSGVEEGNQNANCKMQIANLKITPNPFVSFARVPGHEAERFALYDISGKKIGTYRGDRIGEGLAPGVYFLKSEDKAGKPVRVVKVR
jgi:hypothetical protein